MSDQVIYTVGGTVQASGGIYISREADEELLRLCRAGEFCYVLTARQMGKSSLMVATRERLAAEDIRSVKIDLTEMGSKLSGLTAEQWYLGLIDLIVEQLDLDLDYMAWWDERAHLGPTQRLSQFLRQVMLERVFKPVVIFIDEIDSTLNLDFTDDFFAAIRACYNARASDPAFKRLSFVLLGVATPGDLISDPQRTPFNIGQRVDLIDFTGREAIPLAAGLNLPPVEADRILSWILDWTGGHPYLTQRLCAATAASPTKSWDAAAVDKLVEEIFFGEQSARDSNLRFVRDMLTQRAPDKAAVLKTYRRIRAGKAVPDEERSLAKAHLKLSGIVKAKDGSLHIRNEIYRRVFDLAWVRANTPSDWPSIVTVIAVFIALLAVSFVIHNIWVANQVNASTLKFYQATTPEERVVHLSNIFEPPCLFQVTDYDYQARELFYGLSREEQLALFSIYDVEGSDLIVVVKGLYITLADVDGTDSTGPLLEAMVQALDSLDGIEETNDLRNEISSWLRGRELAKQNQYADALVEYNKAIELNGENPATLYERAGVLIELSEYQLALDGLDQVMAIAKQAPAPTPAASPTNTPAVSSLSTSTPTASSPTPASTSTSTSTPRTGMTPSEASPSASVAATSVLLPTSTETPTPTVTLTPAAIISEFASTGQMISAVRNMIYSNPNLVSSLAGAPSSAYPSLREFGLVPTLTPTSVPTPSLTHTPTQVSIMAPSRTPTQVSTSTPTPTPAMIKTTLVALQTYHGRFVTAMGADRDWVLRAETTELKDWEKFTLLCLDNGKVALETYHGRYVTAVWDEPWELRAETNVLSDQEGFMLVEPETEEELLCLEVFRLLEEGDVEIALKTYHGRYVTAMDDQPGWDWELRAETNVLSDWEKFTLIPLPTVTPTDTPLPTNTPTPMSEVEYDPSSRTITIHPGNAQAQTGRLCKGKMADVDRNAVFLRAAYLQAFGEAAGLLATVTHVYPEKGINVTLQNVEVGQYNDTEIDASGEQLNYSNCAFNAVEGMRNQLGLPLDLEGFNDPPRWDHGTITIQLSSTPVEFVSKDKPVEPGIFAASDQANMASRVITFRQFYWATAAINGIAVSPGSDDGTGYRLAYDRVYGGYSGWEIVLPETDVSNLSKLTFDIKGQAGGEIPNIWLASPPAAKYVRNFVDIEDYVTVNTSWQQVEIPPTDFHVEGGSGQTIDLTRIVHVQIVFEWEDMAGMVYVDGFAFEP